MKYDGQLKSIYEYGQRKLEEGRKEGIKEGTALYMIKEGKSNEEIQKETKLSIEEIEKLRKEN